MGIYIALCATRGNHVSLQASESFVAGWRRTPAGLENLNWSRGTLWASGNELKSNGHYRGIIPPTKHFEKGFQTMDILLSSKKQEKGSSRSTK
jgi:hypothetical protein